MAEVKPFEERSANRQAADRIGMFDQGVAVDAGELGGVTFDGAQPNLRLGAGGEELSGLFGNLAGQTATGASSLTGGVTGAGGELLASGRGLLTDIGGFDPMKTATDRFDLLQEHLGAKRETDRSALESRLFAQGRLDSTAGARQMGEFEGGLAREDAMLLDRLFGESLDAQSAGRRDATGLIQSGATMQGGLFGQALQGAQGRRAEFDPLFQLLNASDRMKQTEVARLVGASNASNQQLQGILSHMNPAEEGGDGMLSGIGTVVGGAAGAYFGGGNPAAIQAGATVGGAAGGMFE